MGCCLSTPNESITQKQEQISSPPPPLPPHNNHQNVSKSPPRAEEEAVKEVLSVSETPIPRPKSPQIPKINKTHPGFLQQTTQPLPNKQPHTIPNIHPTLLVNPIINSEDEEEEEEEIKHSKKSTTTTTHPEVPPPSSTLVPLTPEEISEISDLCSLSEISVSTTTLSHTDQRRGEDDDHRSRDENEVCQPLPRVYRCSPVKSSFHRNGSGSGSGSGSVSMSMGRERVTGRSPVRKSDPSPTGRRNARVVTGQSTGGFGPVDGNGGQRRDFPSVGEHSGRRSRSPAPVNRNEGSGGGWNRSTNLGRSPSGRKTGPSPSRVRMVQQPRENGRRAEEISHQSNDRRKMKQEDEEKKASYNNITSSTRTTTTTTTANNNNNHTKDKSDGTPPDESIENPLVSLECFIFL